MLMTTVIKCHSLSYVISHAKMTLLMCHDYEGVISVLCTPLQVKCYRNNFHLEFASKYTINYKETASNTLN